MHEKFDPLAEPVICSHAISNNHMEINCIVCTLQKYVHEMSVLLWLNIQLTWHGTTCGCNVQSLTLC